MNPTPTPAMADLDKIEALARAATPGPWTFGSEYVAKPRNGYYSFIAQAPKGTADTPEWEATASYFAALDPETVLDLIALARRAAPVSAVPAVQVAQTEKFDEIRALRAEAHKFNSTSPVAKSNISAALDLLDEIETAAPVSPPDGAMPEQWISEVVGPSVDDLSYGQGYRDGWNDCRMKFLAHLAAQPAEGSAEHRTVILPGLESPQPDPDMEPDDEQKAALDARYPDEPAEGSALVARTEQDQAHVMPPTRGTGSRNYLDIETDDQWIFDLAADHETPGNGLFGPVTFSATGLADFAHAIEADVASRFRAQSGITQSQHTEPGQQQVLPERSDTPAPDVESLIPAGWMFSTADFSMKVSAKRDYGNVTLGRDKFGTDAWMALPDEVSEKIPLRVHGVGQTLRLAIIDAVSRIDGDTQGAQGDA